MKPPLDSVILLDLLSRLHAHKNAGYGDAWRKRGELLSIFTNLARKYDRLVVSLDQGTRSADERILDTTGDLCVYAGKYLTWLAQRAPDAFDAISVPNAAECADQGGTAALDAVLGAVEPQLGDVDQCWAAVKAAFEPLEAGLIAQGDDSKRVLSWKRKVELTWGLAAGSAGLLLALGAEDEKEGESWRAEIEAMG
jgi:thymidylate synthase